MHWILVYLPYSTPLFYVAKSSWSDAPCHATFRLTFRSLLYILSCSVYLLLLFAPLIYLFNPFRFVCTCFSVFDFEQKDQMLKRVQTEEKNGKRWAGGDVSQTKHDVEDTQSMANTYSLLRTSPRRDIAALPSNRMRWCIPDCVYRIPATERKEIATEISFVRIIYYHYYYIANAYNW